ncbi:hypothetical protein WN66_04502 [Saccharomyces cerevisiae]|nr:hypothetical protein WN66_04502 [Saccharomyces cerevisiae]
MGQQRRSPLETVFLPLPSSQTTSTHAIAHFVLPACLFYSRSIFDHWGCRSKSTASTSQTRHCSVPLCWAQTQALRYHHSVHTFSFQPKYSSIYCLFHLRRKYTLSNTTPFPRWRSRCPCGSFSNVSMKQGHFSENRFELAYFTS